jgi:hypothetical protein
MCDLRSVGLFCGVYHKKSQLHSGAIAGRWAATSEGTSNAKVDRSFSVILLGPTGVYASECIGLQRNARRRRPKRMSSG